jgi:hypothetical protein
MLASLICVEQKVTSAHGGCSVHFINGGVYGHGKFEGQKCPHKRQHYHQKEKWKP